MSSYQKLPGSYIDEYFNRDKEPVDMPGMKLFDYLKTTYTIAKNEFVAQVDNDLRADGELQKIFYDSMIFYLKRRLIITAEYIFRLNGTNTLKTRSILKTHLENTTRFSDLQIKEIVKLLMECLDTARDDFSTGVEMEPKLTIATRFMLRRRNALN